MVAGIISHVVLHLTQRLKVFTYRYHAVGTGKGEEWSGMEERMKTTCFFIGQINVHQRVGGLLLTRALVRLIREHEVSADIPSSSSQQCATLIYR